MKNYDSHYINGQWVPAASGATLPVHDSSTEELMAQVPAGTAAEATAAVLAAPPQAESPRTPVADSTPAAPASKAFPPCRKVRIPASTAKCRPAAITWLFALTSARMVWAAWAAGAAVRRMPRSEVFTGLPP